MSKGSVMDSEAIKLLQRWIEGSRACVVFTGAGISTESGIPDFRSPGGLWSRYRPIDFGDFVSSEEARCEAWRRRFAMDDVLSNAKPNQGHRAIATLIERNHVTHVITQNIDELHQQSGVPQDQVIELHGSTMYAKCLDCGLRHELIDVRASFEQSGVAPRCRACAGLVKTATISFGQSMPIDEMRRAQQAAERCDVFIALGSSLVVYPAAGVPIHAKRSGARLVIINREPTELDRIADLVMAGEIGVTLATLIEASAT
jgi:NAD-dependent deacetylase